MRFSIFVCLILLSTTVLSQDKTPGEAAFSDGMFNLIIGEFETAEVNFTKAIEAKEQVARSYYFRSKARSGQRNYEAGLLDINESLELKPDDLSSLDMRGKIYLALDRPSKALPDFKKVSLKDDSFVDIHFSLGRTYFELELFETAILEFGRSLAQEPEDSKSYRLRGLSYILLKNDEQGCNDLSKARKLGAQGLDDIISEYCGDVEIAEENQNSEYDWNYYKDPDVIDRTNASVFTEFSTDDPESMVMYFYASKIRGDEKWKDVLQPESQWSERMKYSLEMYEKWNFVNFYLVSKKRHSESGWWIKCYFEIEVNGEKDGGKDEISLKFNGKEWIITKVPN